MTDRLAEIEQWSYWTKGDHHDEHYDATDDVDWLITEVKRLRNKVTDLEQEVDYLNGYLEGTRD